MENCLDFFNGYIMGIVQMLTGFYYYTKFLRQSVRLTFCLLFALFGTMIIIVFQNEGVCSCLAYLLMLMLWGHWIFKAEVTTTVLYSIIICEIMQLCYGVFGSALCILNPFLRFISMKTVGVVFMILGNMAVFAAIYCCSVVYRHCVCDESINGRYAVFILMPTLLIFLVSEYINNSVYGNTIIMDDRRNITNANHMQMFVIQLSGIASLFCIMAAYRKLIENVRFHTELFLLRQQKDFLSQYVEEAKAHYESTRSFRHDIKNHIMVLQKLLQNHKYSQAFHYVSDLEEMTMEMSFPYSTGNPAVDILVGKKLGIAKSNNIAVSCSLTLPYPCSIRDIDLCIILSNALDNAICACINIQNDTEKYIHVMGNIQGDFVLIEIENSFEGDRVFSEGTGLSNIRKVAVQYQGAVNISIEDKAVVLSVLLIIS